MGISDRRSRNCGISTSVLIIYGFYMNDELYKDKYRKSTHRLKGYDYSYPGWYFITINTFNHHNVFGKIVNDEMQLNQFGTIVKLEWERTENIRNEIDIDEYIVMPNHFHALVGIDFSHYLEQKAIVKNITDNYRPKSISTLIGGFKSSVTSKIIRLSAATKGYKVWQSNYYDHIVRNPDSLEVIRNYIRNNPSVWKEDRYYNQ